MSIDALSPAFTEPVSATQQVFRQALDALAEPGLIHTVEHELELDALCPAAYALCLPLLDSDTPLWVAPALNTPALRTNLAFHCACPIVDDPAQAVFALLTQTELDNINAFNPGNDRDPDLSCTLLIQLPTLSNGDAQHLQGPGIEHQRTIELPVPSNVWDQRRRHTFPQGLDMFFAANRQMMGLPRSTRVTVPA